MITLADLERRIAAKVGGDPQTSYTAGLLAGGTGKISQKVGEEAVEVVIAALTQGKAALAAESADLLYHLMVLWQACGVSFDDVLAVLAHRQGMSGLEEKALR